MGPVTAADYVEKVNQYRQILTQTLADRLEGGNFGAFVDSCPHHCGLWNQLTIDGLTQAQAFAQWYAAVKAGAPPAKKLWWQAHEFPCLQCCKASVTVGSELQ